MIITLKSGKNIELTDAEWNEVYLYLATNHNGNITPAIENDKREKQKPVPDVNSAFNKFNAEQNKPKVVTKSDVQKAEPVAA